MEDARAYHTATLLSNGHILIAGGEQGWDALSSAELYDPASSTFRVAGSMAAARSGHSATLLRDGRVLIAGGGQGVNSAELYVRIP